MTADALAWSSHLPRSTSSVRRPPRAARRAPDPALANVLGPDGRAFRELLDRVVWQLRTDAVDAERTADQTA